MKKIMLCLIILSLGTVGCSKIEKKEPHKTSPHKDELVLDQVEAPSTVNIPEKIQSYIQEMSTEEKIGQLLMPAFRDFQYDGSVEEFTESMEEVLEKYKVGGVILFKENIKNQGQTKQLISDLQAKSNIPLWMGVDEEGGVVSRIASNPEMGYGPIETAFDIGQAGDKNKAYESGRKIGSMLRELGFNMDFAPVADVWSNPDNQVIGKRSFGTDPNQVSQMVNEVIKGLQEEEVLSVIKHFPGHGDTKEDSHLGRAFVDRSMDELFQRELIPFEKAIHKGVEGVMIAHVELPQVDPGLPASLSHKIITDILKNQMGFKGLVITDALDMEAITGQFGKGEAALQSFMAGTDILLMPDIKQAHSHLLEAYEDGTITDRRLEESVYKILYSKYQYGVLDLESLK